MEISIFNYKDIVEYIFNIVDISDYYNLMCTCKLAFDVGKQLTSSKLIRYHYTYYDYIHLRVVDWIKSEYNYYILTCESANYNSETITKRKFRFPIKAYMQDILQGYESYSNGEYFYYADIRSDLIYTSVLKDQKTLQKQLNADKQHVDYYFITYVGQEITRKSDEAVFSFYKSITTEKIINTSLTTREKNKLKMVAQLKITGFRIEHKP